MFVPGTYQIQPAQMPLLQNIVGTIKESFPRQIIGIEAHWDNTPLNPPTATHHQLTATQALAVFDQLVRWDCPVTNCLPWPWPAIGLVIASRWSMESVPTAASSW